jgi:regulator of protease activity HflC (stomatin/prohibitin superfamily)
MDISFGFVFACLLIVSAFICLLAGIFTIQQQTIGVIERFGRWARMASPGLNFKNPFFERIRGRVDLKVQQIFVTVETKTKDDVTVAIKVAVQYFVRPQDAYNAFYRLEEPKKQITAYVFDAIRAHVPGKTLDEVYADRELDSAIELEVREKMAQYGWSILDAPVVDISPDQKVKEALNQVNAQKRLLEATRSSAEAQKITQIAAAQAEAESKALQGDGIARERLAIAEGLRKSAEVFAQAVPGASAEEAMTVLLMTQYFDALRSIGAQSNTIMLPGSPAGLRQIMDEIRNGIIIGQAVK